MLWLHTSRKTIPHCIGDSTLERSSYCINYLSRGASSAGSGKSMARNKPMNDEFNRCGTKRHFTNKIRNLYCYIMFLALIYIVHGFATNLKLWRQKQLWRESDLATLLDPLCFGGLEFLVLVEIMFDVKCSQKKRSQIMRAWPLPLECFVRSPLTCANLVARTDPSTLLRLR